MKKNTTTSKNSSKYAQFKMQDIKSRNKGFNRGENEVPQESALCMCSLNVEKGKNNELNTFARNIKLSR